MGFVGIPQFVDCAESFNTTGAICEQLSICVVDGSTTHMETVQDFFPTGNQIVALTSLTATSTYDALRSGFCNVIASDSFSIASNVLFANGYTTGVYRVGPNLYTNEPIALVTREDDVHFSDFINWIVQALLHAEESNINQENSGAFGINFIFGPVYGASFGYAVGADGNSAELYARHLEGIVPRQDLKHINVGDSGLIDNMSFGNLFTLGSGSEGTLAEITSRGYLKCGIARRSIFAEFNTATQQQWQGIDIDLCRAISAAIFDGSFSTIVHVDLLATERLPY
jgi:ABC-type amino acid transport substrate-binding protein